jgi:hypothetical protein
MKFFVVLFFSFLFTNFTIGQSKKEQIESLSKQIDSLILVIKNEKKIHEETTTKLEGIDSVNIFLKSSNDSLQKIFGIFNSKLEKCESENIIKDEELNSKQQLISKFKAEIKTKSDSLILTKLELEKLKSSSKSSISNTISVSVKEIQVDGVNAVRIGSQTWMAQNLNLNKFRNGDVIPEAKTEEDWKNAGKNKQPAWCYYENNKNNGSTYGKLYNWYAVNDPRGLAPLGWHIPTDNEWTFLKNQLGEDPGNKLKSKNGWSNWEEELVCQKCENWTPEFQKKTSCSVCKDTKKNGKKTHSGNGSNLSFLSGLPGGYRYFNGFFVSIGLYGYWWSVSEISADHAYSRFLTNSGNGFNSTSNSKEKGFSVRCIKD